MNCTVHPESAATAYCRTCGKAMCDACKHTVHGVIYCEDCLATRVNQATATAAGPIPVVPAPGAPSPGLAFVLGFIPGVGAMYNGQFIKGLIHVVAFATLIAIESSDISDSAHAFLGLMIAFWVFYMVFDAYKTAKARLYGQPLPDPFGIERTFSSGTQTPTDAPMPVTGAPVPGFAPGTPGAPVYVTPAQECNRQPSPVGAVILIGLGVLFLLNSMGWFHFHVFGRLWPLILIGLGIWLFIRRFGAGEPTPRQE